MVCSITYNFEGARCVYEQFKCLTDLGRFEPNFRFGLQLRTHVPSAILLYIEDAFALQVVNGKVFSSNVNVLCVCMVHKISL